MRLVGWVGGALEAGTVLQGTYEIVRLVGWGGMGRVYEARHTRLPGRFAVKILTGQVSADDPEIARFRREAKIAASLRHPNIVGVIDFNQKDDSTPYLVMEMLEGRDLGAELEMVRRISVPRTADIVSQIASALAAAHEQGIVHRDLKPQNLFLTAVAGQKRELVKVLDFGISVVRSADRITAETRLVGTPQYMSPEQARCENEDVDAGTDQFALAAIAYEMLAGRPAFAGANVPSTLLKVMKDHPTPLEGDIPGVPAGMDGVLFRALSKPKRARFDSVLAFAEAFAAAAGATERATARTPAAAPTLLAGGEPSWRASSRLRVGLSVGLATVLLLFLFSPWGRDAGDSGASIALTVDSVARASNPAAPSLQPVPRKIHVQVAMPTATAQDAPMRAPGASPRSRRLARPEAPPVPPVAPPPSPLHKVFIDNISGQWSGQTTTPIPAPKRGTFVDAL
jgi:serine/threonine-protein kinase